MQKPKTQSWKLAVNRETLHRFEETGGPVDIQVTDIITLSPTCNSIQCPPVQQF